jgi:hypothetical protein
MKAPALRNLPKAREGLWTDPGWHNSGYTQPVEFLRADLVASRPVGGVAYVPRVMSPSWTDGTWNGVYRRWEIYVTDSASSEPADWGVPVAAGEWSWPNGQERKEVRFSAKSGRYVIWPTTGIVADAGNVVPVHEWGHTVGLEDRYDSADALMWYHELSGSHREINAPERGQINWSVWTNADARWGWH